MSSRKEPENPAKPGGWSRRGFIRGAGVGGSVLGSGVLESEALAQTGAKPVGPGPVPITLNINGKPYKLNLEPRVTLIEVLRDNIDLTGSKKSCDRGNCGSCTVLMGGKAVYSCNVLAIEAQGQEIQTIEGLNAGKTMHPVATAFVNHDAQQCGYCTPGFVVATAAFLKKNPSPTPEQVNQGLGGNLCRCGTYMGIRKAVLEAAKNMKGATNG
jgi:xanthine dehydrogenase YagT iron-sulfur-binding subunit